MSWTLVQDSFKEIWLCFLEEKLFSNATFDAAIHFAGLQTASGRVANPRCYFDNNLVGQMGNKLSEAMVVVL